MAIPGIEGLGRIVSEILFPQAIARGFSFYDRAEIKDLTSYLKVVHNPDDSV